MIGVRSLKATLLQESDQLLNPNFDLLLVGVHIIVHPLRMGHAGQLRILEELRITKYCKSIEYF